MLSTRSTVVSYAGMQASEARVLVVDDDLDLCAVLALFLGQNGYQVLTAPDPILARDLLERERVDMVITDLLLPHLDGIGFAEQLRALPRYKDVPILMITGHPSQALIDQGMRKGISLALPKPLDLRRLLDLVGFATH